MAHKEEDRIEVTDENFGDLLIQGLEEVRAIARGEVQPARRGRRLGTAREAVVKPPRSYSGPHIQRIREKIGLSQKVFAQVLNASTETVKTWEQNTRQPVGMALVLLEVAEHHPEVLVRRVGTRSKPRKGAKH